MNFLMDIVQSCKIKHNGKFMIKYMYMYTRAKVYSN